MTVRGTLMLAVIGALLVGAWPTMAEDQWAQTSTYRLGGGDRDRDRDRDRDYERDRDHEGAWGSDRPYFTPTPMPFQGSETRRWQRKLEEIWGGVPAGRGVRHRGPVFYRPYPGPVYGYPPYEIKCDRLGCHRSWQWERGYRGEHNWYDWYGY